MRSNSPDLAPPLSARDSVDARIVQTHVLGTAVLRYGVVFLLVTIGMAKFFASEADESVQGSNYEYEEHDSDKKPLRRHMQSVPFACWNRALKTPPAISFVQGK